MKTPSSKKRFRIRLFAIGAVIVAVFAFRGMKRMNDGDFTASCANHAIQLKFLVLLFAEAEEHFPRGTDTRSAVTRLDRETNMSPRWVFSQSASCPEAFLRDESIGFVYVGDGLPTKLPGENPPLILFCPAESHQRSRQHCHAISARGMHCAKSNAEMLELLRTELDRAKAGAVSYSTNAVALMQQELKVREKHESKRGARQNGRSG